MFISLKVSVYIVHLKTGFLTCRADGYLPGSWLKVSVYIAKGVGLYRTSENLLIAVVKDGILRLKVSVYIAKGEFYIDKNSLLY